MACAPIPVLLAESIRSSTSNVEAEVLQAQQAVRIAGPRLNSNFERTFVPLILALSEALEGGICFFNSADFCNDSTDSDALAAADCLDATGAKIDEVLKQCKSLNLYMREPYSSILGKIEYQREHIAHVAESLRSSVLPAFAFKDAIGGAIEELRSNIQEQPTCPSAQSK